MSSYLRRIEKRIMKAAGVKITRHNVPYTDKAGVPQVRIVSICADKDEVLGDKFPQRIPRKFVAPPMGNDYLARVSREQRRMLPAA